MRMGKENDFRITLGFCSVRCGSTYGCRLIYQSGPLDKRKCKKKTKQKMPFRCTRSLTVSLTKHGPMADESNRVAFYPLSPATYIYIHTKTKLDSTNNSTGEAKKHHWSLRI